MKYQFLLTFLMLSILVNSQLKTLSRYSTNNSTDFGTLYKIKGKLYETDNKTFLSLNNKVIFKNETNNLIYFMIFKNRYLFIGYFPNTKEEIMLPYAYPDRPIDEFEIIDLENSNLRWWYNLKGDTGMGRIKDFDVRNGKITYQNYFFPKKSSKE